MHRRRPDVVTSMLLLGAALSACALPSALRHAQTRGRLQQHQHIWSAAQPNAYRYTVEVHCFCDAELAQGATIEVRNGTPDILPHPRRGLPHNPQQFQTFDTIEELFALICAGIDNNNDVISVQYDTDLGYPASIVLDWSTRAMDDSIDVVIRDFEIVP